MQRNIVAALALFGLTLAATQSAGAPERQPSVRFAAVDRGLGLARTMCADCHAVERSQPTSPNAEAPTFVTIATTPGMGRTALKVFFNSPHAKMPNLILDPSEADEIIDYILSLSAK